MAKFRFRLEKLKNLRELHRDQLRGRLAEAIQAEQVLANQSQQVVTALGDLEELRRRSVQSATADVNQLLSEQRYQMVLLAQQATLEQQAELLGTETEKRRQAVVEADRQVKILDKLRERQQQAFRDESRRQEIKALDEVASRGNREGRPWQA